jgi:DNA-binding beta-propeller fold protein YncE
VLVAISGNTTLGLSLGPAIAVGSRPFGVAVNAAGTQLIVTDSGSDTARTMTVGQATGVVSGNQVISDVGDAPSGVDLIEGAPALAYIANEGSGGSVWVMDPPTKGNVAKKKAKATRKHTKRHRARKHRKHRKAARSAQLSDISILRARAHSLPLVPPVDR